MISGDEFNGIHVDLTIILPRLWEFQAGRWGIYHGILEHHKKRQAFWCVVSVIFVGSLMVCFWWFLMVFMVIPQFMGKWEYVKMVINHSILGALVSDRPIYILYGIMGTGNRNIDFNDNIIQATTIIRQDYVPIILTSFLSDLNIMGIMENNANIMGM